MFALKIVKWVYWEALRLLSDHRLSYRLFSDPTYPDHNNIPDHSIYVYIYPDLQLPRPGFSKFLPYFYLFIYYALVGVSVGRGTLHLYALAGEAVYGWRRAG